ncbi:uncharacterized protein LOC122614875 isoform X3 [Drosophila teissieri]|uniref:uncharacterized protein LOC122614875 isoform X3 n=1 Tax=Drosophila teissieri TaxID=7243 RepID=UPI001CBA503E|nr:uncharacterized protein LOC122614875 isoform X3 [Drosophila teissieri]
MFRRFINLPLKRLWVCHQPSPFIQPWPLVHSNGSPFSQQPTPSFFQDDHRMSYDILTNDLSHTGSSSSIRQVPQKVRIVGEVHSLKVGGHRQPGNCLFISQKGRLYHKESGRSRRESRPDVCERARHFRERSNSKVSHRLRELMNEGVDGLDKGVEKNKKTVRMKRSPEEKYSTSPSYTSYYDDQKEYLDFQEPKRTFRNFVTTLMAKGRKVRQQLQEGKDADLLRYHSGNKDLMQHYHYKSKRKIMQRQLKAKPRASKAKYKDDSIDWTVLEDSLNPQRQDVNSLGKEVFVPLKTKSRSAERTKDKEISSQDKTVLPHSWEVIKAREEKLIRKAKKETMGRFPSLRETSAFTTKPGELKNSIDQQSKLDFKRVNKNIMESGSHDSGGQKNESGLKVIEPGSQKPMGFHDICKNRIQKQSDNSSEKKECKTGTKPNTTKSILITPCPRSDIANLDNPSRSCQNDHENSWSSPNKDFHKKCIDSKKENDVSKIFVMLDDKDKLKFRVAELMARCMFLVEKRTQQDSEGSSMCNGHVEDKDNVNQLVANFWRHYTQCCEKTDVSSSMLGNTGKGILDKVDIIIKECTHIKEVIEGLSLKNQCIKEGLSQSIEEEFYKTKAKLEKMSANEKLEPKSKKPVPKRSSAIESLKQKCQERKNVFKDLLKKMSLECKTSDKYEQDLLLKMKLVIEELQKKLAEDKQSSKSNEKNPLSENKLSEEELKTKCAEEELKKKCAIKELKRKCAEEELKKRCAIEELKEKCAEEKLREMCAIEDLKEKCAEEELKEKCAEEELRKKCAEEELKKKCAKEELKKKCAEEELRNKCAESEHKEKSADLKEKSVLEEFRDLCAKEEFKQKCAKEDFRVKCSEEKLKEGCALHEKQRQYEEFSLRKRCAEFALKKKCENNNKGDKFIDLLGPPKKCSDDDSKKKSADEKSKEKLNENDHNLSILGKLKKKVGLTGKGNANMNKFTSTKAHKWYESFGRRKISVEGDIPSWQETNKVRKWLFKQSERGLVKKFWDKEYKAKRSKELQRRKNSELERLGLGIFVRSVLSRPRRRPLRGLEDNHCMDYRERFFNPRQWPLFSVLAPLNYQTLRRSPLLETNFFIRQLLPDLKPLAINDYLGVYWLHRIASSSPFGKRGYKRDDPCRGSSTLYPFAETSRMSSKDERQ